ncbi:type II toxin-antitoxin system HipA family toxin [Desulfopila aestuarii]|uniref:Serine/threonine-protein kinase HipA n=1 Tax=Desulfopila aestuarii DSM 18488 TaxID=1121416 RepID=A0A1M7YHM7_9BACT|nr:type II toxin-antitoxin system HipA family toxin [Desulfopila aestuarii]SHO52086.1 serine/threonine-protein kinase HipA [Desulfopila aestuarii DSM 18488]
MIKLNVWLVIDPHDAIRAGELIVSDPDAQGRLLGQFKYTPEYLASPNAFALDPVNLPLQQDVFDANRPHSGVHGVFEDSLPDDWGRRILVRQYNLGRNQQRVPHLLRVLGGNAMGALRYSEGSATPQALPLIESRQLEKIELLSRKFETDPLAVDEDMALLFQAASSPGGARPKALVHDECRAYLAKFASVKDTFDVVSLEVATMHLARRAGIVAAEVRCLPCGSRKILLVDRFDLGPITQKRHHCISMQSLLRADGYYNLAYADIAGILRMISANPVEDQRNLFKQMIFNILIGNTDDHLKNFSMLNDGEGWKLSPAYDLVPNIGLNSEHVLRIGLDNRVPDRQTLIKEAKRFGLKQARAVEDELDALVDAVSTWHEVFNLFDVPEEDILVIGRDIEHRLAKIKR